MSCEHADPKSTDLDLIRLTTICKAWMWKWMANHENDPSADVKLASELISFGSGSEHGVVPFLKELQSDLQLNGSATHQRLQNVIDAAITSFQMYIERGTDGNRASSKHFRVVRKDERMMTVAEQRTKNMELCKERIWEYANERWKNHKGRLIARLKAKDNVMGLGWELLGFAEVSGEGVLEFLNKLRMDKEFQANDDESDNVKERKQRILGIIDWAIMHYHKEVADQINQRRQQELKTLTQGA